MYKPWGLAFVTRPIPWRLPRLLSASIICPVVWLTGVPLSALPLRSALRRVLMSPCPPLPHPITSHSVQAPTFSPSPLTLPISFTGQKQALSARSVGSVVVGSYHWQPTGIPDG